MVTKSTPTSSFGDRFTTTCGSNIPNGSSQMANPPCVILTRRVSWNCSALDAKGIQRVYRCSSSRPRTGTNFPDKTQCLGCDLLRIALDSISPCLLLHKE